MALSTQDIEKGLDFTGFVSASAADHNQLVDLAVPKSDSATEGKGLGIWTVDSALDTPVVPDAATTTKWKRYTWVRVPFAGATSKTPILYGWNDDAASDATLLKWLPITADLSTIEADLLAFEIELDAATSSAANANIAAAAAQMAANTALNTANNAQTDATTALALAAEPPAAGSITAAMLASVLDLSDKTITLPDGSVTASMLSNILDLSTKTIILPSTTITDAIAATQLTSASFAVIAHSNVATFAHGLSTTPRNFRWVLVCVTIDQGYAVNAEIPVEFVGDNGYPILLSYADATNCYVMRQVGSTTLNVLHATTMAAVALTEANWRLKCYVN